MTRRKWMFWWPEAREEPGSSSLSRTEMQACSEWTPFLTALFDGEADEYSALQARRHLLVCQRCARTWLDWNQTRNLLINHSAPPPPPNLLWRVRLACRLNVPREKEIAAPELGAQILARTSRQNARPTFSPRRFRLNAPFASALAVGAFVVFAARDSLLSSSFAPSKPRQSSAAARPVAERPRVFRRTNRAQVEPKILAPRVALDASTRASSVVAPARTKSPRVLAPARAAPPRSVAILARARRERESLVVAIRPVSLDVSEPLPMLQAPPVSSRREPAHRNARRPNLPARSLRAAPRPVASVLRIGAPAIVLASAPVTRSTPFTASSPAERSPRVLLASTRFSDAPLRISAPRAMPITMEEAPTPDDSGLDELDSTVEEYRATMSDDSDSNADAG